MLILLLLSMAYAGYYPVPRDAKIHKFLYEGTNFETSYNITCHRDDRLQFWWVHNTKKRRSEEGMWFIADNNDKMKVYMEYSDSHQADERGLRGNTYEEMNKRALMDHHDLIHEMSHDNHEEMKNEEDPEAPKKPFWLSLS